MKQYIVFAGVNGAGKSTLYQTFPRFQNMPRINTDEILKTFGDWKVTSDVMKAGKLAVQELNRCLSAGISFNQETTLCGAGQRENCLPCIKGRAWNPRCGRGKAVSGDVPES